MDLVARAAEIELIERAATAPMESALIFTGEQGIGKTRLLEEVVARSTADSVLIHPNPAEAVWPLSGFSTILAALDDPRAVEFGGRFTLKSTDPQFMFAAARDLLSLLRGLGLPPRVVLIDDLDTMDAESQTLMGFMAGRLAGTGLRFVATAAPLADGSPLAGFQHHVLPRLTPSETKELARRRLENGGGPGLAKIVADQSGGNPLVLVESVRSLSAAQVAGREPLVLPIRPHQVIKAGASHRLAGMSAATLTMLEDIALAPVSVITVLTDNAVERIDALDEILYSGFAVAHGPTVRLREPLLRSFLYWHLRPHDRRERHSDLAERYRDVDDRLATWHGSFTVTGDQLSADLVTAATQFAAAGDVDSAVELAERAILVDTDPIAHHQEMFRLVAALTDQGELDLAEHYLQYVQFDFSSASLNMQLASNRISIEYEKSKTIPTGDVDAAVSLYGDADPDGATRLLAAVSIYHSLRWELDEASRCHRLAGKFASRATPASVLQHQQAVGMMEAVDGSPEGDPMTDRISTEVLQSLSVSELVAFGGALTYRERYAQARRVFTVVFRGHPDEPLANETARSLAFANEVRAGDFHRAHAAVEDWQAVTLDTGRHHSGRALALTWDAISHENQDAAAVHGAECMELASVERNQAVLARLFSFQGTGALLRRDYDEAVRLLLLADATAAHVQNLSLVRHCVNLVEACVASGRLREAEAVLRRMIEQQAKRPSRWLQQALARAKALTAPDHLAAGLFLEAVAVHGGEQPGYELGRTLLAQGERLGRLGLAGDAEHATASASAAFEKAGATAWARRADSGEPKVVADSGTILSMLTAEEREVAEMVRRGFRNREIAGELYISLRTVELRLTHIYRKVGARSRSHLASLLT